MKKFFKRKIAMLMAAVMVMAMSAIPALAAEGDPAPAATTSDTVITAMQTGMQGFANDALKMIAVIVPIALGVAGVIWLARKAMGWFKSMAK